MGNGSPMTRPALLGGGPVSAGPLAGSAPGLLESVVFAGGRGIPVARGSVGAAPRDATRSFCVRLVWPLPLLNVGAMRWQVRTIRGAMQAFAERVRGAIR